MQGLSKKVFAATMIATVLLTFTGCSQSADLYLPYETFSQSTPLATNTSDSNTAIDFMSKKLCVVKKGEDKGGDSLMTSASSILFDVTDKKVLYADHIYQKVYPASLTKLLTALVVLQNANLNDVVTVSYNASHITEIGAKLCGLKEGDKVVLGDLLTSFLVYSGNDAGIAIAEHISGSESAFADLMNKTAKSIGAVNSHFVNSHGLHDDNHYTTAYDLYLIFQELMNYDQFLDIIKLPSYTLNYIDANSTDKQLTFSTTNKYLKGEVQAPNELHVVGGKTGTTNAAGNCLAILVEDENGKEYIAMVLKANGPVDLYNQLNELMKKIK